MRDKLGRGLYVLTPQTPDTPRLLDLVERALEGGAAVVQYRDKSGDRARRRDEARRLLDLCRAHSVPLIVNDDIALAAEIGADGVHLGREDGTVAEARGQLGKGGIIGASCYNDLRRAEEMAHQGADYVAFGSFFQSPIKPRAVRATPELLVRAKERIAVPIVAIGGITADNGGLLIAAGADLLAVISGVFAAPDIRSAALVFSRLFTATGAADPRQ